VWFNRLNFIGVYLNVYGWTRLEPSIRRFAGYPTTGGAVQDVHVTPAYGPWKQTFSRSTADWAQHGDLPRKILLVTSLTYI